MFSSYQQEQEAKVQPPTEGDSPPPYNTLEESLYANVAPPCSTLEESVYNLVISTASRNFDIVNVAFFKKN